MSGGATKEDSSLRGIFLLPKNEVLKEFTFKLETGENKKGPLVMEEDGTLVFVMRNNGWVRRKTVTFKIRCKSGSDMTFLKPGNANVAQMSEKGWAQFDQLGLGSRLLDKVYSEERGKEEFKVTVTTGATIRFSIPVRAKSTIDLNANLSYGDMQLQCVIPHDPKKILESAESEAVRKLSERNTKIKELEEAMVARSNDNDEAQKAIAEAKRKLETASNIEARARALCESEQKSLQSAREEAVCASRRAEEFHQNLKNAAAQKVRDDADLAVASKALDEAKASLESLAAAQSALEAARENEASERARRESVERDAVNQKKLHDEALAKALQDRDAAKASLAEARTAFEASERAHRESVEREATKQETLHKEALAKASQENEGLLNEAGDALEAARENEASVRARCESEQKSFKSAREEADRASQRAKDLEREATEQKIRHDEALVAASQERAAIESKLAELQVTFEAHEKGEEERRMSMMRAIELELNEALEVAESGLEDTHGRRVEEMETTSRAAVENESNALRSSREDLARARTELEEARQELDVLKIKLANESRRRLDPKLILKANDPCSNYTASATKEARSDDVPKAKSVTLLTSSVGNAHRRRSIVGHTKAVLEMWEEKTKTGHFETVDCGMLGNKSRRDEFFKVIPKDKRGNYPHLLIDGKYIASNEEITELVDDKGLWKLLGCAPIGFVKKA